MSHLADGCAIGLTGCKWPWRQGAAAKLGLTVELTELLGSIETPRPGFWEGTPMTMDSLRRRLWQTPGWLPSNLFYLFVTLVFLGAYIIAGGAQGQVSGLPEDFDLHPSPYPVQFGEFALGSEDQLAARIAGEPVGSTVVLRDGGGSPVTSFTTVRAYGPFHTLVVRLNGFLFLAVSLVVFAPRVDKVPARDLFWACTLYGLAVMIGGVHVPPHGAWYGPALPLLRIFALAALPIFLLHVGLTFPRRLAILDRQRRLVPAITLVGLAIATWHSLAWLRWLGEGSAESWAAVAPARTAAGVYLAVVFGAGCIGLVAGSLRAEQESEREQAKWLLWGIAMGSVPFIFLHALPAALGMETALPVEVARVFSLVIPLAFSSAVVRYRFLEVDIIIRRSLLYFALASLLVGVYAILGIFVGQRIEQRWPETGPFVPIVATVVAALLFAPTRRGVGTLIDRLFFKIRYDHKRALAAFEERLQKTGDQEHLARVLGRFLRHHLGSGSVAVKLVHEDHHFLAGGDLPPLRSAPPDTGTAARKGSTSRAQLERAFPGEWERAGFALFQTVNVEGDDLGMVLLGPKRNARRYVAEDLDLLEAACEASGRRLRRINLEQDFVAQVVARHQIEEMNCFRTQFFAQFAHDLRSPLTSINWGARNLLDGVVGEFTEPQRRYLEGIEASARQLVRLVNNLLEVTRLEFGMPEVEFGPVSVIDVVGESVSKLRATAAVKRVELRMSTDGAPPVQGHPEKLLEVVDNLVENAIRYSSPDSTVEIEVVAVDNEVELRVLDRGPGLEEEEIGTIFEPYRQGQPSPHSTQHGFGLGLFVVKSWIEKMDGQVEATNRAGGGACFRLRIPIGEAALGQISREGR